MKKPMIGVIPLWDDEKESLWMLPGYFDGIRAAGGLPIMLPLNAGEEDMDQLDALCDGLLFTGGHDVDPALYGQTPLPLCGTLCPPRDRLESELFRRAFAENKPVLGICRGLQLINVLLGGTLYQDIPTQFSTQVEHHMEPPFDRPCHSVRLGENTPLQLLAGVSTLEVNSYHHQGIDTLSPDLVPMAWSQDNLVEAAYCPARTFLLAVQWHPEFNYAKEPSSLALFQAFVRSCGK